MRYGGERDEVQLRLSRSIVPGSGRAHINVVCHVDGNAPLHGACSHGHVETVLLLLGVPGVDVKLANRMGRTPLHCACLHGHAQIVEYLLRFPGVDLELKDCRGRTALYVACNLMGRVDACSVDVAALLIDAGADIHAEAHDGQSPLDALRRTRGPVIADRIAVYAGRALRAWETPCVRSSDALVRSSSP